MIICHCKGITDRDLLRAVDVRDVTEACRAPLPGNGAAGTGCGSCLPLVQKILSERAKRAAAEKRPAPATAGE